MKTYLVSVQTTDMWEKELHMNMKMKTLVISRKTALPISIQKCLETAGGISQHFVAEPKASQREIAALLSKEEPRIVMIDGEYGPKDKALWAELTAMDQ